MSGAHKATAPSSQGRPNARSHWFRVAPILASVLTVSTLFAQERPTSAPASGPVEADAPASTSQDPVPSTREVDAAEQPLAQARHELVEDCASDLSRLALGLEVDDGQLLERIREARRLLDEAEAALKSSPQAETLSNVQDRIDLLRAFAAIFEAIAQADDSAPSNRRLTEAGVQLAAFADDPNTGIAESAAFWQSVAYRRAGRIDRSLQLLPPRLTMPRHGRLALFGQIQRCRALARTGRHAAALPLSLRLEVRVPLWLGEESAEVQRAAESSLRWVRIEILRDWASRLKESGDSDLAKEVEQRAKTLLADDAWPPPDDEWFSLDESIAGLDAWDQSAEPAPPKEDATTKEAPGPVEESEAADPGGL